MNTENILKADLLDIIFENRNKNYGAYPLRKYYHERIYKALGITFLMFSILSVYILLHKPNVILTSPFQIPDTESGPRKIPEKKTPPPVAQKPKVQAQKQFNSTNFSNIKIVDSTDRTAKPIKNLDSTDISNADIDGPENKKPVVKAPVGPEVFKVGNTTTSQVNKEVPQYNVDIMPAFPGGNDALIRFLQRNLRNPRDLEDGEMISVKIMFVVGYDGTLKAFKTIEDGGAEFNNEVIRVLKKMPAWIPGKTAGENVSVYYTIPVKFVPQE